MPANRADKPGFLTSEFWLTVLVVVAATVLRLTQNIDADAWMVVTGGSTGLYNVSRGMAKK